ncbi:hypothetical protein PAMP_008897 [Pampus punctatissimus]
MAIACDGFKSQITLRRASTSYDNRSLSSKCFQPEFGAFVLSLFHNKSIVDSQERPFSRLVLSVMEDFLSERRLGRIYGRRKRMDVDGQAAVGDQLTTGICFRSPTRGNGGLETLQ